MAFLPFLKRILTIQVKPPSLNQVFAVLSLLGFSALCFLLGSAIMFFRLPPSQFLHQAFQGAEAWGKRGRIVDARRTLLDKPPTSGVTVDIPEKTADGFTLFSTTSGSWAGLIDMKGKLVHRWQLPFTEARAKMKNVPFPLADKQIHWFGCRLFPNGDLLAVYHVDGDTPAGYGLVRIDKDSKLLWAYPGRVHHDVELAEDGNIYALEQKLSTQKPEGMDYLSTPYVADYLVVLSAQGKEIYPPISLLEAFRDSKYSLQLRLNTAGVGQAVPRGDRSLITMMAQGDYLHPNAARLLGPSSAGKFPMFKAGQVLLSLRNIDTLAVLDIPRRAIVWTAQGIWKKQHSPEWLPNGHVLLYDNVGGKQTRVLEMDPADRTIAWAYANENSPAFLSVFRGVTQRLSNGNTLIVNPDKCRIFEVTPGKEVVWDSICLEPPSKERESRQEDHLVANITTARRYRAEEVPFLKGISPRP